MIYMIISICASYICHLCFFVSLISSSFIILDEGNDMHVQSNTLFFSNFIIGFSKINDDGWKLEHYIIDVHKWFPEWQELSVVNLFRKIYLWFLIRNIHDPCRWKMKTIKVFVYLPCSSCSLLILCEGPTLRSLVWSFTILFAYFYWWTCVDDTFVLERGPHNVHYWCTIRKKYWLDWHSTH